jgi:hypothetical protein
VYCRGTAIPGSAFALFLATSAVTPTADTNVKPDVTEIATGNGYVTGGNNVARDSTDWDVHTEDDALDLAKIQIKDEVWTAAGGPIPASGGGARWGLLTDQHVTPASREIEAYFDLASDRTISSGQTLTLQDVELRLTE